MKVLVTGATGFLGRSVVEALLARGHTVRAQARAASRTDHLRWEDRGVEIVRADLRGGAPLAPLFEGIDTLIHLAAAVTGGEDAQFAATVVGTERLLEAMRGSPCRTIVLASSFSVYDWRLAGGGLTEDTPVESDLYARDGYTIAKVWQERLVRRMSAEHGWRLVVLRPGFIWGRENAFIAGLGQQAGRASIIIAPAAKLPLTHVDNCADAFVMAAEKADIAAGQTFNVVDGHDISSWAYAGRYLKAKGVGYRLPLPYGVGLAVAHVAERTSKLLFRGKGKLPGILMPNRFRARFRPVHCRADKLKAVLGWSPPLGLEACLARTFDPPVTTPEPPRLAAPSLPDAGRSAAE